MTRRTAATGLSLLAHLLVRGATGTPAAAAHLALADAAERDGDGPEAAEERRAAVAQAPRWPPAVEEAALAAEDSGRPGEALELYRAAGVEDHRVERLRQAVGRGRVTGAARNAPCPCGSGRKAKRCCGGGEGGSLVQRAGALAERIAEAVDQPRHRATLDRLLDARCPEPRERETDVLIMLLAVFDEGVLEAWLAARGPHLPDDERALVERWRGAHPELYRVEEMTGAIAELRRLDDEATLRATMPGAAGKLRRGTWLVATLVDDGAGGLRSSLLLRWSGRCFPPGSRRRRARACAAWRSRPRGPPG